MRSHSMETMVSSQKKQHSGGIPGSLSGGISHNSMEVTKTTFSVRAQGPGAAWGPRGGSFGPLGRVEQDDRGKQTVWGAGGSPCPLKCSLHPRQNLGLAQTPGPPFAILFSEFP